MRRASPKRPMRPLQVFRVGHVSHPSRPSSIPAARSRAKGSPSPASWARSRIFCIATACAAATRLRSSRPASDGRPSCVERAFTMSSAPRERRRSRARKRTLLEREGRGTPRAGACRRRGPPRARGAARSRRSRRAARSIAFGDRRPQRSLRRCLSWSVVGTVRGAPGGPRTTSFAAVAGDPHPSQKTGSTRRRARGSAPDPDPRRRSRRRRRPPSPSCRRPRAAHDAATPDTAVAERRLEAAEMCGDVVRGEVFTGKCPCVWPHVRGALAARSTNASSVRESYSGQRPRASRRATRAATRSSAASGSPQPGRFGSEAARTGERVSSCHSRPPFEARGSCFFGTPALFSVVGKAPPSALGPQDDRNTTRGPMPHIFPRKDVVRKSTLAGFPW